MGLGPLVVGSRSTPARVSTATGGAPATMQEPATGASRTDAEVVRASLGHPAAFAEIFDRHHEPIHRFLWTRAGDAADDLAAEVFRIAFERRHDFDLAYESARPWLFGIAANLARTHHRRTARRHEAHERLVAEERPTPVASPHDRLEAMSTSTPVARALLNLADRDREPLLLFAWADLTYDEIAEALDVPVGTVRSRIHRARAQVRERLATHTDGGVDP